MEKNEVVITLYGRFSDDGKTFVVDKNARPGVPGYRLYALKRGVLRGAVVIQNMLLNIERKALLKLFNANSGLSVVFFCDEEGKMYFLDEYYNRCFISPDLRLALSEDLEYFKLERTSDGGLDMIPIPPFRETFPYKYVDRASDNQLNDIYAGFIPIEEADPFRDTRKVINIDEYRFREQKPKGR